MGYIEKKTIAGRTYYYLTATRRVGGAWKKTRKYLGVHTPAGFEKPRRSRPKSAFSKSETAAIGRIRSNYSKKHRLGPSLWKAERERLVSFIFNTNAIEGNTLTLDETASVLAGKRLAGRKKDVQEAKNMKQCVDFLFSYKGRMDEAMLLRLHGIEMRGVLPQAGTYRTADVKVGNYVCPRHEDVPLLMGRFFTWLEEAKGAMNPFELAGLAHLRLVRIHPFRDGNGRIARLLMNMILLRGGYPLLNIFNSEKMLYYLVLRKVDATGRSRPFVRYLGSVYVKQYSEYLSEKVR